VEGIWCDGRRRTARDVEEDILGLAEQRLGVTRRWRRRIVRAGHNALATASDYPDIRMIEPDDTVYVDLGPVFEPWEAVGGKAVEA
jgi:Xaa-Pro dipeptidase